MDVRLVCVKVLVIMRGDTVILKYVGFYLIEYKTSCVIANYFGHKWNFLGIRDRFQGNNWKHQIYWCITHVFTDLFEREIGLNVSST